MRAYSSRVTPCSAATSGVTLISALAVAIFAFRGPSVDFLFQIALKSRWPIDGWNTVLLGVVHRLTHFHSIRDAEKGSKFAPNGKTARRAIRGPANVHNVFINNNVRAIVDVRGLQDRALLRTIEIKPPGFRGIFKDCKNAFRARRIQHETTVLLSERYILELWNDYIRPRLLCFSLPVQFPRAYKFFVA